MDSLTESDHTLDPDVLSFDEQQRKNKEIFLIRRKQYGDHRVNTTRFPLEHKCGLYLKAVRIIRDFENGKPLKEDTLRDISIYSNIILSSREIE